MYGVGGGTEEERERISSRLPSEHRAQQDVGTQIQLMTLRS